MRTQEKEGCNRQGVQGGGKTPDLGGICGFWEPYATAWEQEANKPTVCSSWATLTRGKRWGEKMIRDQFSPGDES